MKLIFLIIPFSLLLNAQHPGDNIVRQGGNAFYNYEFERSIEILGKANPEEVQKTVMQPKKHSLEFLRDQAHLRFRTNTFGAVFRIRHAVAFAIHQFFNERGFYYLHTKR